MLRQAGTPTQKYLKCLKKTKHETIGLVSDLGKMQTVSLSVGTADSNILQTRWLQVIGEKLRAPTLSVQFLWGDACVALRVSRQVRVVTGRQGLLQCLNTSEMR